MVRETFSIVKIFGSIPVHPDKFKELDKKIKWLGKCEEGDFCTGCGTTTPLIPKSHHINCSSYDDSNEYPEHVSDLGHCPECDSPDGLSISSSVELGLSQISCSDCQFMFQKQMNEEDLITSFNDIY